MKESKKTNFFLQLAYWLLCFCAYVLIILAAGATVGSIAFAALGNFFVDSYSFWGLLKKGAWVGFRYAGVWAGGLAIVLCCMRAGKLSQKKAC